MTTPFNDISHKEENRLPKYILDKAIKSGIEFGWKQNDFIEVVQAARQTFMAIVGGQIQYVFTNGTCELYWLSYDPEERQANESWLAYCNRTADECIDKFNNLIRATDIEKEALTHFHFLKDKKKSGVNINDFLTFILYFDDNETKM
jgi:hypothetical protein